MRSLILVAALLLIVPTAVAAGLGEQRVTVDSSDYTSQTEPAADDAVHATVEIVVGPLDLGDVDVSQCDLTQGTEMTTEACDEAVRAPASAPTASVEYDLAVDLDALTKRSKGDDGSGSEGLIGTFSAAGAANETTLIAYAATATVGLAAIAYALSRFLKYGVVGLIPLYSHISDDRLLDDGNRRRIFDLIREEPGVSTKEIADRLGLAWGTVTHHLGKLEKRHFVVSKKFGKYRRYFVNGAAPGRQQKETLAILKVPATAEVATAIRDRPGASQKEVSEMLGVSSSTILWHVKRLQRAELVEKVRDGKQVRYFPSQSLAGEWEPMGDLVSTPA